MTLLLLLLTAQAPAAPDPAAIVGHITAGELDKAHKKCDRWQAQSADAGAELRDACARAYWPLAEESDTVEAWSSYRQTWAGTRGEAPALEREARSALLQAGPEATEGALTRIARQYAGTASADLAQQRAIALAVSEVANGAQAVRVVRDYPDATEAVTQLMEAWPAAFTELLVNGRVVEARLRSGFTLPDGVELRGDWAIQRPDGSVVPWAEYGRAYLLEAGLSEATVDAMTSGPRPYGWCSDWTGSTGGVAVFLGNGVYFEPRPFDTGCQDQPAFLTVDEAGQPTALSLAPGHLLQFPTGAPFDGFAWQGAGESPTRIVVPAVPDAPVTVGDAQVVGQRTGELFLVHPVAGGLPWLTDMAPPDDATSVASHSTALPRGWSLTTTADGTRVDGPHDGEWLLPPGAVRVLTPPLQWATGLHRNNPKVSVPHPEPLPGLSEGFWKRQRIRVAAQAPQGTTALTLTPTTDTRSALYLLTSHGVSLSVDRAWTVQLDDDPQDELVAEATLAGHGVRVLVDTYRSGARRVFLLDQTPAAEWEAVRGEAFAFTRAGTAYVAWTSVIQGVTTVEALNLDERGLVRQVFTH